jgi:hypothetical protein
VPRTIIVSDLHGDSGLLERAIAHAGLAEDDTLIVAGDLIDVGPDDTIGAAESAGAVILAGNHEVSAAIGLRISPQHAESLERGPEFAQRMISGEWPLAVAVDGWLVTHAGISLTLDDMVIRAEYDAATIAADLNARFAEELSAAVAHGPLDWDELGRYRLLGSQMGPLWFRPIEPRHIPGGVRQIVGHTPPDFLGAGQLERLTALGWLLVEPGGHGVDGGFRYAVIDSDGAACVVDG